MKTIGTRIHFTVNNHSPANVAMLCPRQYSTRGKFIQKAVFRFHPKVFPTSLYNQMYQTQFPAIANQLTAFLQNISHLLQYKTNLPQSCVCPLHQLWSMVLQDFLILHKVGLKLLAFFFICSGTGRAVVGHVTQTSGYVQAMATASQATLRRIITIRSLTRVYFVLNQVFT